MLQSSIIIIKYITHHDRTSPHMAHYEYTIDYTDGADSPSSGPNRTRVFQISGPSSWCARRTSGPRSTSCTPCRPRRRTSKSSALCLYHVRTQRARILYLDRSWSAMIYPLDRLYLGHGVKIYRIIPTLINKCFISCTFTIF